MGVGQHVGIPTEQGGVEGGIAGLCGGGARGKGKLDGER